jgi:hypothetical protein
MGSKALAMINGSAHGSFTDLPLLAESLGMESGPEVEAVLGTIGGGRTMKIVSSLVMDLAAFVTSRGKSSIVGERAGVYEEVNVLAEKFNGRCKAGKI